MKKTFSSLLLLAAACFSCLAGPKADPKATVVCGNARFTVLTDRLIRMEWSATGVFEDRASLAVVNRELPVPHFSVRRNADGTVIRTGAVTLRYSGQDRFSEDNLSVTFDGGAWTPGADASGNLLGTVRTLDGCKGFGQISYRQKEMEPGLLSRDGWAIIDESGRPLFEPSDSDWQNLMVENPDTSRIDWYIMAYGHDYKTALGDFTRIAGKVPMPPKYTLGYWWSRYWAYTDEELLGIASDLRSYGIPSDVFVIDMGWHKYWKELWDTYCNSYCQVRGHRGDEFAQRIQWTGYSWNRDLIRQPDSLLADLHGMGFKTTLNIHPASGVRPFEDMYQDFRRDYLSRTDDYDGPKGYVFPEGGYTYAGNDHPVGTPGADAAVPFRLEQKAWADAYFNSVLHPIERQGVDFWWLDWQQWLESKYAPTISNTFLCNYMFWQDKVRQNGSRPLIYHRWGGLGSHRYQLGFSGDSYELWSTLKFIPYFTATASNVCYGYWGHDIGGHQQEKGWNRFSDGQLYTRWMQGAVFTPIFKTHSTESKYLERKIWKFPEHFEYLRDAIRLRYALAPYIYTAARETYDTGICICRPLYYEYPEEELAYTENEEYFFGSDILATVVCEPVDSVSGVASRPMWFPAGNDWYDMASHTLIKGGTRDTLTYAIDRNPWYPKAGALIPLAPEGLSNLQSSSDEMRLLVVPGGRKSSCRIYEDDGDSRDYDSQYAFTTVRCEQAGDGLRVTFLPREGSYAGAPDLRRITLVLEGWTSAPSKVTLSGRPVEFTCTPAEKALSTRAVCVSLPATSVGGKDVIVVRP